MKLTAHPGLFTFLMNVSGAYLLSIVISVFAIISASVSDVAGKALRSLELDEAIKLCDFLRNGACLDDILAFIGSDTIIDCDYAIYWGIMESLKIAAENNQVNTLQVLLSRIRFTYEGHGNAIKRLLNTSLQAHTPEVCDLLMSHDFEPTEKWRANFWNVSFNGWILEELIALAVVHPGYAAALSADHETMEWCHDRRVALMMIEYNNYLMMSNPSFASFKASQPSALFNGLLQNRRLNDEDMVLIAGKLMELGAEIDQDTANAFLVSHPDHIRVHQALRRILYGLPVIQAMINSGEQSKEQAGNPEDQSEGQASDAEKQPKEQASDPEDVNPEEQSEEEVGDREEQPEEDASDPEKPPSPNQGGVMAWIYSWF